MRKFSVKLKLTIWLTVLMSVMSVFFLILMLSLSSTVVMKTATSQLIATLQQNISHVSMVEGKLHLEDGFVFSHNGVSTLIYSKNKSLLAGQIPVSFTADESFQSGLTRSTDSSSGQYLVTDIWLPIGWEDGLWVRSLMEAPEQQTITSNILGMAAIALPIFIILAALGSYLISKHTFRPLENITATVSAINEAKDLSGRINIPSGNDEFTKLATSFDKMFERLEHSFDAEKQFTADASHELRTPISIIKGACEYGQKYDETPKERTETLDMIHRQAVHMSNLISQLLSMTRLDQGTELVNRESLDLSELVRSTCCEYTDLIFHLEDGVIVLGDSSLLSRLLLNLIENAYKYGGSQGSVSISVSRNLQEGLLSVKDNGIGISPENQEKIWQRFYQVDASHSENSGAGLGLSMVHQIALSHGGYMSLDSALGVGSIFTLHLPLSNKK